MSAKHMFKFSPSFFRDLVHKPATDRHRRNHEKHTVSPMIFVGSWQLQHSETSRTHSLVIGPDLTVNIDHHTIPAQVESLTDNALVLLDHYGYHITITVDHDVPVQLFDEADDVAYFVLPNPT